MVTLILLRTSLDDALSRQSPPTCLPAANHTLILPLFSSVTRRALTQSPHPRTEALPNRRSTLFRLLFLGRGPPNPPTCLASANGPLPFSSLVRRESSARSRRRRAPPTDPILARFFPFSWTRPVLRISREIQRFHYRVYTN